MLQATIDESIEVAFADYGHADERAASATEADCIGLIVATEPTWGLRAARSSLRDGATRRLLKGCNMSVAGDRRRDHLVKLGGRAWLGSPFLVWVRPRTAMCRPGKNSRLLPSAVADKLRPKCSAGR